MTNKQNELPDRVVSAAEVALRGELQMLSGVYRQLDLLETRHRDWVGREIATLSVPWARSSST